MTKGADIVQDKAWNLLVAEIIPRNILGEAPILALLSREFEPCISLRAREYSILPASYRYDSDGIPTCSYTPRCLGM